MLKGLRVTMSAPLEGILAVNKPSGISSAEVLRRLQQIFNPSPIFADSLAQETARRNAESHNQRRRRNRKKVEVKIGHGGTLDPLASGILITGIGRGTKQLGNFQSNCTKTYEVTALLGCETDTYDSQGKVLKWAKWDHVEKEAVEKALEPFRGDIMQKPPIYSALSKNGMRLYEYARKGIPLPDGFEIEARPVRTESLEFLDFTFDHTYEYPKEEAPEEEKVVSEALEKQQAKSTAGATEAAKPEEATKTEESVLGENSAQTGDQSMVEVRTESKRPRSPSPTSDSAPKKQKASDSSAVPTTSASSPTTIAPSTTTKPPGKPPAISFRMTVTSGFYVRSFVHDLGQALGSAAHMVKLIRTQQGDYSLGGENTFEWEELMDDLEKKWEQRVEKVLRSWAEKNPPKSN